jgi:hypothetical protein
MDNNIEKLKELITDHFDKLQNLQTLLNQKNESKPTTLKPTTLVCSNENTHYMRHKCNLKIFEQLKTLIQTSNDCDKLFFNDYSVIIKNKIGKGAYGTAYLTQIYDKQNYYDIIIKKKLKINKDYDDDDEDIKSFMLSQIVEQFYSPHFLYFYNNLICENQHNLLLIEKVNGTVYDQIYDNKEKVVTKIKYNNFQPYLKNIISQIIISIFTLHQYTNCYHNDTHLGNIFVIEYSNTSTTFLKYNFNNIDYELELYKYLVVLGDYGLIDFMINSSFISRNITYFLTIIYEYIRPLSNFLSKTFNAQYISKTNKHYDELIEYYKDKFIELSETNKTFIIDILKILLKYNKNIKTYLETNSNISRIDKLDYIKNEENNMINEMISQNLILDNINIQHTNFYNSSPYYLNNKEYINSLQEETTDIHGSLENLFNNNFESLNINGDSGFIYHFVKNNNIVF